MKKEDPRSIRLSDDDYEEALLKADAWGLRGLSAVSRFAIKRLPYPKK
jgi:hypothetical protein